MFRQDLQGIIRINMHGQASHRDGGQAELVRGTFGIELYA